MNSKLMAPRAIPSLTALLWVLFATSSINAALPVQPEQIVVTCFSGSINYYSSPPTVTPDLSINGHVVAQFDTTTANIGPLIPPTTSPPELWDIFDTPPFSGFHNETGQRWNAQRLGEVFGICVDDAAPPNIYVTATECYNIVGSATPLPKGPGGPGGVYRLDGTTGTSSFGSLPNNSVNGPGLGNVCFRRAGNGTGYLYVSDLEDGKIYRMHSVGLTNVGTAYDHGVMGRTNISLPAITDDGTPGLTQFGRRVWGVKTYQNKLYYAVWWEDSRNISLTESNEIWSVSLDNNGDFVPNSAQRLISLPNFTINQWSHPVASIDFSPSGAMYLAERYWQYLAMVPNATLGAHHTRVLRYTLSGPNWITTPSTTHHIGGDASFYFPNTQNGANSAGGVAVNCNDSIWATGDMWNGSYTPYINGYVYGALRIPPGGNSMYAGNGFGCLAIDYDGNISSIAKFGIGAIATVRDCCLPPPSGMVAWWPLDEATGAPTYADLSGNGNTALVQSGGPVGSFNSPSAIPGKVAVAGSFLDSNTRGRAPNAASLNFGTNSFALDCWVRPAAIAPTAWQTIVDKFDTNTLRGYTAGISNGTVVLRVGDGTTYTHIGPAIIYNAWNFVAVNVNRTANNVRFYVNGVGTGPQALAPTGIFNNTLDLLIGAPYEPNIVSETALDEIELFNRVLTTNELSDLWLADALGKCKSGQPPCSNSVVSIVCPTNMTVACAPIVFYPPPQAATTCGTITNIVCTPPSGSIFPVGTNLVTCTAQDSLGNSNSCTFTITVTPDVMPPVLDCQCLTNSFHEQLHVVGCVGLVPSLCQYHQCFSDNCGLASCSQTPPAGTPVGPGVTPITVTIWDFAGNSNSCVVMMTVTAPPGGCAGPCAPSWKFLDLAITSTNGIFTGVNGTIKASTSGGPFMSMNNSAYGSQFPVLFGASGIVTGYVAQAQLGATYSVTFNLSGYALTPGTVFGIWNTTEETDTYKIQVYDCASNQIAPPFGSGTFSFLGWDDDLLSGNIGWYHLTLNPTTGLLATTPFAAPNTDCDAAFWTNLPPNACRIVVTGNSIPDSDGVVFYFAEPQPCCEIICPTNITVTTCDTNVVVVYPAPVLTNCAAGSVVICNPPSGSTFPLGTNTVTCSVVDPLGGTTTSCSFKIIVKTPPGGCGGPCEISCPTNIIVTTCGTNAVVYYPAPVTSGCGAEPYLVCNPPSGSTFPLGTNTVTCSIVDSLGGVIASCEFQVIVLQSTSLPPWTVLCPPFAQSVNVTGCPPIMPNLSGVITIVTNCTLSCPPVITQSIPPGTPLTAGNYVAIVNICDCLNHCAVCDIAIKAYATTGNPTITCPPNQVVTTCGTNAIVKLKVKATGNTGVVTCVPPSGSTFPLGTTWVTCTATNACGGIATCSFSVTVKQPLTRWPCDWQVGIGIPFEPVGGASYAIMPLTDAERAVSPVGPKICVFPNPINPSSGVLLHPQQAGRLTFTTALDFTAPVGAGVDLVLPPSTLNTNDTPILSFRNKGPKGYCVKMNKKFADDPTGTFRCIAVNTNGNLLDSFTFSSAEAVTNEPLVIGFQPGVTNCHVTVELNLVDGSMSVEFEGPVVPSSLRKGWDGCIYGPDRPVKKPKATARVIVTPPVSPGQPPISDCYLYASGIPEFTVEDPTLASVSKPRRSWSDGHVTLIKLYDDEGSTEFGTAGPDSVVQVDVGHAESFDLRLLRLETNTIPGEELLTRTVGSIGGLADIQPPYLDALLLRENSGHVECSADFSNLGSPTVHVLIYSNNVIVAERTGVAGSLGQPLFTLPTWPDRLGKLGGTTPCRGGKVPLGLIVFPDDGSGLPPEAVEGDEFRILAELPPGAAHPDYYSAFQFLPSDGGDWAVENLTTTSICVAQPVNILHANGNVTVSWSGNIFRLQGAETIAGPWYDLGVASPVTLPAASNARFFRLVCD